MEVLGVIFVLMVLFPIRSSITSSSMTFHILQESLFKMDTLANVRHNIVFCGNFSKFDVIHGFAENHLVALQPENWILETLNAIKGIPYSENSNIVIFVFQPSDMNSFHTILNKRIHTFYTELMTPNDTSITFAMFTPIFLVSWPLQDVAEGNRVTNQQAPEEILEHIKANEADMKTLPQNSQVYILYWEPENQLPNIEQRGEIILNDVVEVYGIQSDISIAKSVYEDEEVMTRNLESLTSELLRFAPRRSNFLSSTVYVLAQPDTFYSAEVEIKVTNYTVEFLSGSSYSVLQDFVKILNFTYQSVAGTGWMTEEDGHLTGLGHQIITGEADLCISTSSIELYRAREISFLPPISNEEVFTFFRQPSIVSARNVFTMPFSHTLWYMCLITWTILCGSACVIAYLKDSTKNLASGRNRQHEGTAKLHFKFQQLRDEFHFRDVYIWSIGVFCQQGWSNSPLSFCMRVTFITALVTSVLLYSYYTGAFVASISAPIVPVKRFSDLIKYQFQIFTNPSVPGYIISFAENGTESDNVLNWSELLYQDDLDSVYKIMKPNSRLAHIIGSDGFYSVGFERFSDLELCEIDKLKGDGGARVKDAMFVRKGSGIREILGVKTLLLLERGLNHRYWREYDLKTTLRCIEAPQQMIQLAFLDCYTAFGILFIGHLMAFSVVLFESKILKFSYTSRPIQFNKRFFKFKTLFIQ